MTVDPRLRELLARQLVWQDAHVGFDRAVADFPPALRGVVPEGFVHSGWQLVEHIRRAQADILDFCVNSDYVYPTSMDDYWPKTAPEDDAAWEAAVAGFRRDAAALQRLARDEEVDLLALVPCGTGAQTYARELLVAGDHNAYHLGQLAALRRALGCWEDGQAL